MVCYFQFTQLIDSAIHTRVSILLQILLHVLI